MLHKAMQNRWTRLVLAVLGTFINCFGMNYFIVPMSLYGGGVTGVCQLIRTMLERVVTLPAGVDFAGILYLIFNIPILILAWRTLGRGIAVRTIICTLSSSLFLSILTAPATPIVEERIASCLVGGILCGFGLGLTLTCGSSSGGLDIVGLWLSKRGSRFTVGRFSLGFNAVLYALCAILFDVQTALYSVIYNVFCSLFVDRIHQQNISVQMLIFTHEESHELEKNIMERIGRGVTYWDGVGAYTDKPVRVLCVCVSKFEEDDLRSIVREIDPHAFLVVQEGVRVGGNFPRRFS